MSGRQAITLRGMRFHALIGILPHERELPQPVEVDATVWVAEPATGGEGVLDYRRLYDLAAGALSGGPTDYLEDAAAAIVDGAMALPGVARARVAVRKPNVALPGPVAYAEVVLSRGGRD